MTYLNEEMITQVGKDQLSGGEYGIFDASDCTGYFSYRLNKFIGEREEAGIHTYQATINLQINEKGIKDLKDAVSRIRAALPQKDFAYDFTVAWPNEHRAYLYSDAVLVAIRIEDDYYELNVYGHYDDVEAVDAINEWKNKSKIEWHHIGSHGPTQHTFQFKFESDVYDSHYPYLKPNINKYMDDFRKASATMLLLMGVPGTGKSTFIKHYIRQFSVRAMLTHDEELLTKDHFLVNFLASDKCHLLIVEDADLLIKSREFDGNRVMAKLLNISDGVLSLTHGKKIILSTNLTELGSVDDALLRPGRCHDIINFRKLSFEEANKVRADHGMDELEEEREYTLAELFNNNNKVPKQTLGFIKRTRY